MDCVLGKNFYKTLKDSEYVALCFSAQKLRQKVLDFFTSLPRFLDVGTFQRLEFSRISPSNWKQDFRKKICTFPMSNQIWTRKFNVGANPAADIYPLHVLFSSNADMWWSHSTVQWTSRPWSHCQQLEAFECTLPPHPLPPPPPPFSNPWVRRKPDYRRWQNKTSAVHLLCTLSHDGE